MTRLAKFLDFIGNSLEDKARAFAKKSKSDPNGFRKHIEIHSVSE